MLFIRVVWGGISEFCYIPKEVQLDTFDRFGRRAYIKLPKPGTNPRGVEITGDALIANIKDKRSRSFLISWSKTDTGYNPYERWVEYWQKEK